jgi:hypothetical protein
MLLKDYMLEDPAKDCFLETSAQEKFLQKKSLDIIPRMFVSGTRWIALPRDTHGGKSIQ